MRIAIIGGRLQGVEAVYLAKQAGYRTLVIDKNSNVPATGLCDKFMKFEFSPDTPFPVCNTRIDLILPAVEDEAVLSLLEAWSVTDNIPFAFDPAAYTVSTSKLKSNRLFEKLDLPIPKSWPGCSFPVVVKPDKASGSQGVEIIDTPEILNRHWLSKPQTENLVIQEFVEGPSYSVEVLGYPGNYHALQVTDLGMDSDWDCNAVTAPSRLPEAHARRFKQMAVDIAEALRLRGIMDLEAILHKDELRLLEIDARLPSQTPMTVYWSTGINMVELMVDLTLGKPIDCEPVSEYPVMIEHIKVAGSGIEHSGEHIMAGDGPLKIQAGFFGADEAVTSFDRAKSQWVATLIFKGRSQKEVNLKRARCYDRIAVQSQNRLKESFNDRPFQTL